MGCTRRLSSARGGCYASRMRVFLSGPMGAGKSTLGREVAAALELRFVDLDERIEARAGLPVSAIFAERGEPAFRELEREEALGLLGEDDVVVALGGGTVVDDEVRRALLRAGTLVTLTAPLDVLLARVGDGRGRPLLAGDAERLRAILAARSDVYAEAHGVVDTSGEDALDAALEVVRDRRVVVALGARSYAVEVGEGVRDRIAARLRGFGTPLFVADENTLPWREALEVDGPTVVLPAGEEHKTVESVARIWDAALDAGIDRRGIVVAVGGGVVGDLAGFAAASILRGVAFGQVPTTLLAMVDSSVGGKTGFNRRQGKNLVGAFHQPRFVLCDVETLRTLPTRERIAGLAEVVKSAWIAGTADVAALEADADALRAGEAAATRGAIERSVRLKAEVVEADEREAGRRMVLNLGHTLGHALEAAGEYRALVHGEAVALGMIAAARVGRARGAGDHEARLVGLLERLGLPTDLDPRLDDEVFGFLGADKKRVGDAVRFVVPGGPGEVEITPMTVEEIRRAVV